MHVSDRMQSTMVVLPFDIDLQRLAEYCHRNHIRRLSVFGSALPSEFGPHSDLDVHFRDEVIARAMTLYDAA
jgi:predicted nucleotidyltransferase